MNVQSSPRVSSHARLRFVQRTTVNGWTARSAWRDGTPVEVECHDYHHARYNKTLDVVLLARGGVITTVLDAALAEFTEGSQ